MQEDGEDSLEGRRGSGQEMVQRRMVVAGTSLDGAGFRRSLHLG